MRSANIFLINNTYTELLAKRISDNGQLDGPFFCFFIGTRPHKFWAGWARVFAKELTRPLGSLGAFLEDRGRSKSYLRDLEELVGGFDSIRLFLPNINHILCNHLFYRAEHDFSPAQVELNSLVEGTLYYRDREFDRRVLARNILKSILVIGSGLRFNPLFRDSLGAYSARFRRIYAFDAAGLVGPADKVRVVPFGSDTDAGESADSRICLILAQHLFEELSSDDRASLSRAFSEYVSGLACDIKYLKPHPRISELTPYELRDLPGTVLVNDAAPAETVVSHLGAGRVIAVGGSSAFMGIKHLYGNRIECIAWGMEWLQRNYRREYSKLAAKFRDIGVQLVD